MRCFEMNRVLASVTLACALLLGCSGSASASDERSTYMSSFEKRVTDRSEVAATYSAVNKMVNSDSTITSKEEREQLALNILQQAANPLSINQGKHNTCAFAAIESRIYTLYPHAAADLIMQVATTGKYRTTRGEVIELDQALLRADDESRTHGYANRSYASQLFQLTTANVYWQRQEEDPRGIKSGAGTIHYIQKKPSSVLSDDTGERLQIFWPDGIVETVVDDSGKPMCEPCVSLAEIQEVGNIVAEVPQQTFVIAGKKFDKGQKYIPVKSMDDLRHKLLETQQQARMPLVAAVDSTRSWFTKDPTLHKFAGGWYTLRADQNFKNRRALADNGSRSGWHAICITAYDPQSDRVSIDNFWGPHADHVGENAISLTDLYSAFTSN